MADEYPVAKKLAILLPHLIRHNDEHAEDLGKWIVQAEEGTCTAAAKEMKKAQALMEKISGHLLAAAESVGVKDPAHTSGREHGHHHDHEHGHDHDHGHHHDHKHTDHDHDHSHGHHHKDHHDSHHHD